jgi:hypothetical protein
MITDFVRDAATAAIFGFFASAWFGVGAGKSAREVARMADRRVDHRLGDGGGRRRPHVAALGTRDRLMTTPAARSVLW